VRGSGTTENRENHLLQQSASGRLIPGALVLENLPVEVAEGARQGQVFSGEGVGGRLWLGDLTGN